MTPSARTQAAIELLDAIITAAKEGGAAADTLIARYFSTRRYAGSKDRRAVRELVYAAIRASGERPVTGRAAMLRVVKKDKSLIATFDGSEHGPAPIDPEEARAAPGVAPKWIIKQLRMSGLDAEELPPLVDRAPLDIRVNPLVATAAEIAAGIEGAEAIPGLTHGLRLPAGTNVDPFGGSVEVQDAGSQIVTQAMKAQPGQRIVDLCAGGGGKTLALAAAMENQGEILCTDTDRSRLSRLPVRAEKAGVSIAHTRLLDPGKEGTALLDWHARADGVLVDAPCSGTGTWRRNPEARWRLSPDRIAKLVVTQRQILGFARDLVKPGGSMVYIVCSLLDVEGADQVAGFLRANPSWRAETLELPAGRRHGAGVRLTPLHDGTDGFFVARLIRS